jgi:hypothetical protein
VVVNGRLELVSTRLVVVNGRLELVGTRLARVSPRLALLNGRLELVSVRLELLGIQLVTVWECKQQLVMMVLIVKKSGVSLEINERTDFGFP